MEPRWRLAPLLAVLVATAAGAAAAGDPPSPEPSDRPESMFGSLPTTVKTSENDTVLLPCYFEDYGNYTVRWWRDGQLLADSGNSSLEPPERVRMWSNHTLEVSRLTSEDTGEYMCEVVRPAPWGPIRQLHAIEVIQPPSVTSVPDDGKLEVKLGDVVRMECKAYGVPQPIITWTYNGNPMQLIDHRSRLKFKATSQELSGLYQCIASNGVGEPAVADIQLTVLYPPNVTAEQTWAHAAPSFPTELACIVYADPEPRVVWLKDGKQISTFGRFQNHVEGNRYSLIIKRVEPGDFGNYTCKASNQLGHEKKIIEVSGVAKPAEFKKDRSITVANNYTLIWEVDSYSPLIEYHLCFRKRQPGSKPGKWTKLVIPADKGGPLHSKSYTLTGLEHATVYEAKLASRNQYGWSAPSEILRFGTEGADLEDSLSSTDNEILYEKTVTAETPNIPEEYIGTNGGKMSKIITALIFISSAILNVL